MQSTFYGQFVAGADEDSIGPTIEKYRENGIKSILDYAAEEVLDEGKC